MKISRLSMLCAVVAAALVVTPVSTAADALLVVCAPGFPGSTAEAQPAMDDLAAALGDAAGWRAGELGAVYFEKEADGVDGLRRDDAVVTLVTLPFFLVHKDELGLQPLAQAVPDEGDPNERWTLVAGAGRIAGPEDLAGWKILSLAGYAPGFVRGAVFEGWGAAPEGLEIVSSNRVLTALRRAASGDDVAVLLDGRQAEALDGLPFAADLEVVRTTGPMPSSLLCAVGERMSAEKERSFIAGALGLSDAESAVDALAAVRLDGFVPLDGEAVERATTAFGSVSE